MGTLYKTPGTATKSMLKTQEKKPHAKAAKVAKTKHPTSTIHHSGNIQIPTFNASSFSMFGVLSLGI